MSQSWFVVFLSEADDYFTCTKTSFAGTENDEFDIDDEVQIRKSSKSVIENGIIVYSGNISIIITFFS